MQGLYISRTFKANIHKDKFSSSLDYLPKGDPSIPPASIVMFEKGTWKQTGLESIKSKLQDYQMQNLQPWAQKPWKTERKEKIPTSSMTERLPPEKVSLPYPETETCFHLWLSITVCSGDPSASLLGHQSQTPRWLCHQQGMCLCDFFILAACMFGPAGRWGWLQLNVCSIDGAFLSAWHCTLLNTKHHVTDSVHLNEEQ